MKKYGTIVLLVALVAAAVFGGLLLGGKFGKSNSGAAGGNSLQVKDLQADPTAYKGRITVAGVVAAKATGDSTVFGLVDTAEAKQCKSTGCASFVLPVKFTGAQPKQWDRVTVSGVIDAKAGLVADKVDVLGQLSH